MLQDWYKKLTVFPLPKVTNYQQFISFALSFALFLFPNHLRVTIKRLVLVKAILL